MNDAIEYGGIYWVSFAPSVGHEYDGRRPAIVIQSEKSLRRANLVTVMPLTAQSSKSHGDDIFVTADKVNKLYRDSLIKVHHIESFDRSRFLKKIGRMDDKTLEKVRDYLTRHFNL